MCMEDNTTKAFEITGEQIRSMMAERAQSLTDALSVMANNDPTAPMEKEVWENRRVEIKREAEQLAFLRAYVTEGKLTVGAQALLQMREAFARDTQTIDDLRARAVEMERYRSQATKVGLGMNDVQCAPSMSIGSRLRGF